MPKHMTAVGDDLPTPPTDRHAGRPSGSNLGGETERLPNTYIEEHTYRLLECYRTMKSTK